MAEGHLLVLLDDEAEAELVARLLSNDGYEIDLTDEPDVALSHLREHALDVAVVGLQLQQGHGGLRVLAEVRALPEPAGSVAVVLIADRNRSIDRLRAWEAGADAVLTKPFHIDELRQALLDVRSRNRKERVRYRQEAFEHERQVVAEERAKERRAAH